MTGYTTTAPTADLLKRVKKVTTQNRQFITGTTVKTILKAGHRAGYLIILGIDTKYAASNQFRGQALTGIITDVTGPNPRLTQSTTNHRQITTATSTLDVAAWWHNSSTIILVAGTPHLTDLQPYITHYPS